MKSQNISSMVIGDIQLKTSESIAEEVRPHLTPIHRP